ncbi:hypothetical protein GC176_18315 [bacterium]|nr:hypothetical protein [bacterium]
MSDLPDRLTLQRDAETRDGDAPGTKMRDADDSRNANSTTVTIGGQTIAAQTAASSIPITVRIYGIKDVTLAGYLLMWAAGVLVGLGLIALSYETQAPTTEFGERLAAEVRREPRLLTVAIWSPPVLLAGIGFELIEGVVVLSAFRRAASGLLGHTPSIE